MHKVRTFGGYLLWISKGQNVTFVLAHQAQLPHHTGAVLILSVLMIMLLLM